MRRDALSTLGDILILMNKTSNPISITTIVRLCNSNLRIIRPYMKHLIKINVVKETDTKDVPIELQRSRWGKRTWYELTPIGYNIAKSYSQFKYTLLNGI